MQFALCSCCLEFFFIFSDRDGRLVTDNDRLVLLCVLKCFASYWISVIVVTCVNYVKLSSAKVRVPM
jgi:hypothetical protein